MGRVLETLLTSRRWDLKNLEYLLGQRSPLSRIHSGRQKADDLARRAALSLGHGLQIQRSRLSGVWARLTALNPLSVLRRGFAVVTHSDGRLVRSVTQVAPGDPLAVTVQDGKFGVEVQDLPHENQ
jgi:exodeoxyribonuclease VII large subunit